MSDLTLETTTWKGSRSDASAGTIDDIQRRWYAPITPGAALGVTGPLKTAKHSRLCFDFLNALREGIALSNEMVAADETDEPNAKVWDRGIASIEDFIGRIPAPLFTPLQQGGLSLEWHDHGLNIELRFRENLEPYAVIEDARSEVAWRGRDLELQNARNALARLASRCA